jgi:hypothetical protein
MKATDDQEQADRSVLQLKRLRVTAGKTKILPVSYQNITAI